ncbi:MAG TPA: amidohydrolase family protein [Candidatus Brocadiia bacterium]|nr:amidohydrolase family protein [Candidatus Brocadiia bacterium]
MTILKGRIVAADGVFKGALVVEEGRISRMGRTATGRGRVLDFGDAFILPGFIDLHVHGLLQFGVMDAQGIMGVAAAQPRFGVTGFTPGAASLSVERYLQFADGVRQAQREAPPASAKILGAHFEGPFIAPERRGGMDAAFLREPSLEELKLYLDRSAGSLKIMTLSPELPGALDVIRELRRHGAVASVGHSAADARQLDAAIAAGATHVCHLFNAFMRPSEFSTPPWTRDAVFAWLRRRRATCEVICDMRHVPPGVVRDAAAALGPSHLVAVTDGMTGAGLPPGASRLMDGREYTTDDGVGRLVSTGQIVGSVITMNRALANLVEQCGLSLPDAAKAASSNPARVLGLRAGVLAPGRPADIAVLNSACECVATFIDGRQVHGG